MPILDYAPINITLTTVVLTSEIFANDNKHKGNSRGIQILLVKDNKFNGHWHLPTSSILGNQSIREALEVSLDKVYIEHINVYDNPIRDDRERVISLGEVVVAHKNKVSFEGEWFWININSDGTIKSFTKDFTIYPNDLAIDHSDVIQDAINKISNKILYSNVVFEFLPEQFTVRDCQEVCEWIKGKPIYSYRRYIDTKIESAGISVSGNAHRPAELFKQKIVNEEKV